MLCPNRKIPSATNNGASATTARRRERMIFANATITNQSINNGLIRTTNTVAWSSGNGGNGSSVSIATDLDAGAVNTTIAQYNSYIASVPTLPPIPPPPVPNSALTSYGCNIAQYNNNGVVQWTTDISGAVSNHSMTTDGTNVYAVGDFSGALLFVNTNGTQLVTPVSISTMANGSYIVKYNVNGIAQWATYLTSQTYLQLLASLTDGVNSYQAGTFFTNLNVYNANGILYRTLKQNVSLFNASAITNDSTYIYIIDSNPNAYKLKTNGEIMSIKSLGAYGVSTVISSVAWQAGYLYIVDNQQTIWQLNTTFADAPIQILQINGIYSITTDYQSKLYLVNTSTPNSLCRIVMNNEVTPPTVGAFNTKTVTNSSSRADGIILPFSVSYTNHGTLSNGHLLIADYNNAHYPDVSGIIWDVSNVNNDTNWDLSGHLYLTLNASIGTGTGTGTNINIPQSVYGIYADPNSYNIYVSLYGANNFLKYTYATPASSKIITNLGNGSLLTNITGLNNILYTLNDSPESVLYSITYSGSRVSFKQLYPLAANYNSGVFLKYTPSGAVSWVTEIGASNANCTITAIAIGPTGIYVTGSYGQTGNLVFYNPPGDVESGISLSSVSTNGGLTAFVAKYTTAGNIIWAASIGNLNTVSATALYVDAADNVYAAGTYNGNRMSGPLNIYSPNSQSYNSAPVISIKGYNSGSAVYLVKFNKLGVAQWGTNIIGAASNTIYSITATTTNIYIAGVTSGNITCYNTNATTFGPINISVLGDGVIINYNTAGIAQWVTNIFGGSPFYISVVNNYLYVSGNMTAPTSTYDVPYDNNGAVIPPPSGQPVLSGVTIPLTGVQNDFLIAYNTNGITQWANNTSAPYLTQPATGGLTYGTNVEYVATSIAPPSNTALYSYGLNLIKYNSGGKPLFVADISGTSLGYASLTTDGTNTILVSDYYLYFGASGIPYFINADKTVTVTTNITGGSPLVGGLIVKYNSSGIALWTNNIDWMNVLNITNDGNNIYVAGYTGNGCNVYNLDGSVFHSYPPPSGGDVQNGYLIKYDSGGNPVWSVQMTPTTTSPDLEGVLYVYSIIYTGSNIYITGAFGSNGTGGTVTQYFYNASGAIQPGVNVTTQGTYTMLVVKYNISGTPLWATKVEYGDGSDGYFGQSYGVAISADTSNNIYALGWYGLVNHDVGQFPLNVYSATDQTNPARQVYGWNYSANLVLVKYNSSGVVQWAVNMSAPYGDPENGSLVARCMTVDGSNIYVSAYSQNSNIATYDPANSVMPSGGVPTGNTMIYNGQGFTIGVVIVYNTSGTPLWKTLFTGTYPYSENVGVLPTSITVGGGNVYVSGWTDTVGTPPLVSFYSTPNGTVNSGLTIINNGSFNNFVVAYNSSGKVLWVKNATAPGSSSLSIGFTGTSAYSNGLLIASAEYEANHA